ncbi:MAG: hypothetical protein ACK4QW_09580 [Alphaproteobacteria bacterium]
MRRLAGRIGRRLGPVVHNPVVSVVTGVGMLLCGVVELIADIAVEFEAFLATHHGLILFGTVMALRGFVDLSTGLDRLDEGLEEIDAAGPRL